MAANDPAANKATAAAFYDLMFNQCRPRDAVERYVGDRYVQHNPMVADGTQGFVDYFERMARDFPGKSVQILRSVAEGDLVALHTRQRWPGGPDWITMDMFRFVDGKIVEHWDALQEVPTDSANGNSMF